MSEETSESTSPEYGGEDQIDNYVIEVKDVVEKITSFPSLSEQEKQEIITKAFLSMPIYVEGDDSVHVTGSHRGPHHGDITESWLEEKFNTEELSANRMLSGRLMEANKLFTATLIAFVNKIQRENGVEDALTVAKSIHGQFLSWCPSIASYVGNTSDQIELLLLASRGSVSRETLYQDITGEIVYRHSFGQGNYLKELFEGKSPTEQVSLIGVEHNLARYAAMDGDWAMPFVFKTKEALMTVVSDSDKPPLVRLVAADRIGQLDELISEINDFEDADSIEIVSRQELEQLRQQDPEYQRIVQEQAKLHLEFATFGQHDWLTLVAPGVCANSTDGKLNSMVNGDKEAAVSDWQPNNEFGISEDDMFLIQVAHEYGTKAKIESELGVKLSTISFDTQIQFLRFAMEANNDRYGKLVEQLAGFDDESDKMQLIDAFLSLEFGDDFGDRLLNISEKLDKEKSQGIFRNINEIRRDSKDIAAYFDKSANNIEPAIKVAWIKRTTELLSIIADNKSPESEINAAITALDIIRYATGQIKDGLGDKINLYRGDETERDTGHMTLKADNGLTLTIRSDGGSPRIGFTVKVLPELIPDNIEKSNNTRLSIRFDLDEHGLSLDIGSSTQTNVNSSPVGRFIGDELAKGELTMNRGVLHGNHVREAFEGIDINRDDFANIVHKFVAKFDIVGILDVPESEKHAA